jgi:hypothetical protein
MTFFVGSSQIVLATSWHIRGSTHTCPKICKITVTYQVVADTVRGTGSYSNGKFGGREIVPLKKPSCRKVTYEMVKISGNWKIQHFPLPYVNPGAVIAFYRNDIESMLAIPAPKSQADMAAYHDRKMIIEWERRQLSILSKLAG